MAWVARSGTSSPATAERVLKIGHALPENHPVHAGIQYFADRTAELSAGRLQIDVFASGQLGDETRMLEQVQRGTLDFTKTSAAPMGNFVNVAKVFSIPYLFRDEDHYWATLTGPIGAEFLAGLEQRDDGRPTGFVGITFFDSGSRNFYTNRPILEPGDLAGLKIRVMRDPVAMDMVSALGASPAPLGWGELYSALKQGVVDGAENNSVSFVSSKHYEICKHFSFNHHSRIPDVIVVSSNTWAALSEQEKAWLNEAAAQASAFQRGEWSGAVDEALAVMEQAGVTVHYPDPTPFAAAVLSVVDQHAHGSVRELYEQIQAVE